MCLSFILPIGLSLGLVIWTLFFYYVLEILYVYFNILDILSLGKRTIVMECQKC